MELGNLELKNDTENRAIKRPIELMIEEKFYIRIMQESKHFKSHDFDKQRSSISAIFFIFLYFYKNMNRNIEDDIRNMHSPPFEADEEVMKLFVAFKLVAH